MRTLIAGESGPGPNENDEYESDRAKGNGASRRIYHVQHGRNPPSELGEFVDPQQVGEDGEHAHGDADRAEDRASPVP